LLFSMRISGGRSGMEWYFDYGKLTCVWCHSNALTMARIRAMATVISYA
jgi:hypothetical protein